MIRPGARLGELEVLALIGSGGQGEVYLARPWEPRAARRRASGLWLRASLRAGALTPGAASRWRLGALKVARPEMAASLHDEHGHLAAPDACHLHLVRLYRRCFPGAAQHDLGLARVGDQGAARPYLSLAYEPGVALSRSLARRGARGPAVGWSVAVAAQAAQALAHLHGRGVVHHDVRPANLVVRPGPHAVLLDLGAAETPGEPRRRAVYGVPDWLPPERLGEPPAPASPLVDIYGVGALLRALTAGGPAPARLARLIDEATAPDPARRGAAFPTMGALIEALALVV